MFYILRKSTGWSPNPSPYAGKATCLKAGIPVGRLYFVKYEAEVDAKKLGQVNSVGFNVVPVKLVEELPVED